MVCCSRKCRLHTLLSVGAVFITFGAAFALFWTTLYNGILSMELVLTNTSKSYQFWKETPIPTYIKIYMFNWTNADEVIKSKWAVKPKLQECGPYVFSEHHVRVNVTWNQNDTVTFRQIRTWHFMPSMSNGSLNDSITNINPIVAVAGSKAKNLPKIVRKSLNLALEYFNETLYFTKTVDELFMGYEDPILHKLHEYGILLPFKKFGWFYIRNNSASYDGTFTMNTGRSDLNLLGQLTLWNGLPKTTAYTNSCAIVNGTTGELWPPVLNRERVEMFLSDICGQISFEHNGTEVVKSVVGKKFIGTNYSFDNGSVYPEQACYQDGPIIPSGLRGVSNCMFGTPAFLSYPHFYLADPIYLSNIEGLNPNQTLHESQVIFEPMSGIPLSAKIQFQLNIYLESISGMSIFSNINATYMPMLWFSPIATVPEQYYNMLDILVISKFLGIYLGWFMFALGVGFSVLGYCMLFTKRKEEGEGHLIENEHS